MTTTTTAAVRLSPAEAREYAARVWRESVARGEEIPASHLGPMVGRAPSWGRTLVAQLRAEQASGVNGQPTPAPSDAPASSVRRQAPATSLAASARQTPSPSDAPTPGPSDAPAPRQPSTRRPVADASEPQATAAAGTVNGHRTDASADGAADPGDDELARRSWLDTLVVLAVALVAAAASYGHMLTVAHLAGEPVWIARAFPITVDGLALAALRRGQAGRWWLVLALAVSIAANVLAQFPEHAATAGPIVSAWPPVALYGTHRLLQTHTRPQEG